MNKYLEIFIILAVLAIILASFKLGYANGQEEPSYKKINGQCYYQNELVLDNLSTVGNETEACDLIDKLQSLLNTPEVVLVSQKLKGSESGFRDIVGQVKNIGNETATYVEVQLTIYDKQMEVSATDSTFIEAAELKPGQKSTFTLSVDNNDLKDMDHYELSLDYLDQYNESIHVDNVNATKTS